MHMLSLVEIYVYSLSSGNEKRTDGRTYDGWTDGRTDRHKDVQRETKIPPSHYCVAGYKNKKNKTKKQEGHDGPTSLTRIMIYIALLIEVRI